MGAYYRDNGGCTFAKTSCVRKGIIITVQTYNEMEERNNDKVRIGRRVYRGLSYLVAFTFILIGAGILTGMLLPEPYLSRGLQRLIMGGVILIYGAARMLTIYLKGRKEKKEPPFNSRLM
jgi:hypothetical protein